MIQGVIVRRPKVMTDARGAMIRMLRADDPEFAGFGEVYFSVVNAGVVKGWKRHREMTMTLSVPSGCVLLVVHDDRPGSATGGQSEEIELSAANPQVVTIAPMLWTGFMGLAAQPSVLANCASILHRPDEADSQDLIDTTIPYRWRQPTIA